MIATATSRTCWRRQGAPSRPASSATALANTLQRTLIPPVPPEIPHLTVSTAYRPAGDGSVVGGDFYDVFQVGADDWCVVLGDVSGKGISAATVTSFVRYTIRALAIDHPDPCDLLHRLDHAMHVDDTDHYCTLVLARLTRRPPHWAVQLALAGHPPAVLRSPDGHVVELGTPGTPVGLVDAPTFSTAHHLLQNETITLLHRRRHRSSGGDGWFGESRLHDLIAKADHDPQVITEEIARQALRYQGGGGQR